VPASGALALWGAADLDAALSEFGLPPGEEVEVPLLVPAAADGATDGLVATDVLARRVPMLPATRVLAALPSGEALPAWRRPGDSVLAWSLAAKLALEVVAAGRVIPLSRAGTHAGTMVSWWRAGAGSDRRVGQLADAMPIAAYALRRTDGSSWDAADLLIAFLDAVADSCGRGGRRPVNGRGRTPRRPWIESWSESLGGPDPVAGNVHGRPADLAAAIDEWAAPALHRRVQGRGNLALRLHTPETDGEGNLAAGEAWHVDLLLQSAVDPEQRMAAAEVWRRASGVVHLDQTPAGRIEDADTLLSGAIAEAAQTWAALDRALDQARPDRLVVTVEEAAELLSAAEDLRAVGVDTLLPPELDAKMTTGLRARIVVGDPRSEWDDALEPGRVAHADFGAARLTDFRYEVVLGEDALSPEEFAELVGLKQPIVRWRDRWIRLDATEVAELEEIGDRAGTMGFADALAAALGGVWEDEGSMIEAVAVGEIAGFVKRLRTTEAPTTPTLIGIDAELRPYQARGVAWLQAMGSLGLGAVLADDMGLGKTLQAIALIAAHNKRRPHLVVCPTSVVGNWEREIAKFAPGLEVSRHHGMERAEQSRDFKPGRVTVTTYALLRRDIELLEGVDWGIVVFDEAQQIKNAASKGAKAARRLPTQMRVVMTGTPVENRLADLWSLLDVVNPGLLGSQRRFTRTFAIPIERWRDDEAAQRLRRMVAPFVLRRRKDDPDVALSLPPKTEMTVACTLTTEQATLYQAAVDEAFGVGLGDDGIGRRGRILRLLTALKQICNHPAHYLGETGPLATRSGKLARVTEILEEVVANGDHALVFTQFKKMGDLLVDHFGTTLGLPEVPFLHGGVALTDREAMVDRFQDADDAPPVMVVSLRAGGTGLNLTRATEVVHFDRWWNPAVEDQATDRVHRIGQDRPVNVHKLVAAGTVEDRITAVLDSKRNLVERVVGTGETWLTELGDDELRELVALSTDAVEDEVLV